MPVGSDGADHKQSCQGDAQDTDDPHDTVPCIVEPIAFELSQVLFPVVSVRIACTKVPSRKWWTGWRRWQVRRIRARSAAARTRWKAGRR